VDKETIVEGSFNWLSAARDSQSQFHRLNSSLRYQGVLVEQFATRAERVLKGLRGMPWALEGRSGDRSAHA
jgi:hypothetical protein